MARRDLHAERRTSYWDTAVRIAALKGLPCNRHDLPAPLAGETPAALVARHVAAVHPPRPGSPSTITEAERWAGQP